MPISIGFEGNSLWGYGAGLDALFRYDQDSGDIVGFENPSPPKYFAALGSHPTNPALIGVDSAIQAYEISVDPVSSTLVGELPSTSKGDIVSFGGEIFTATWVGLHNLMTGTVSSLTAGYITGFAKVPVSGGTQLWAFERYGDIWHIEEPNDPNGTPTLVDSLDREIWDAASKPCCDCEIEY